MARGGRKKRPFYHIVVAEVTAPRDGSFVERLGTYNPLLSQDNDQRWTLKEERVKHWLSVGAQPTDRMARFFAKKGLIPEFKVRETPLKSAPGKKATDRLKEKQEALEAAKNAQAESNAEEASAPAT